MFEPPEVHHERLLVVSVMGFIVNMIGIFVFQHGGADHGHSHGGGGGGHGHSHGGGGGGGGGGHEHSHDNGYQNGDFNHSHAVQKPCSHGHSHESGGNKIFQGIFLHILADTLGSVGVIISSLLIRFFGWNIADPICSMIIAVMISLSVIPLLSDSTAILMQRQPKQLDKLLPDVYRKVKKKKKN